LFCFCDCCAGLITQFLFLLVNVCIKHFKCA
jgi:hypothetical protein